MMNVTPIISGWLARLLLTLACCLSVLTPAWSQKSGTILDAEPLYYETAPKPVAKALREISFLLNVPINAFSLPEFEISGEFFGNNEKAFMNSFASENNLDWLSLDNQIIVSSQNDRMEQSYQFTDELEIISFQRQLSERYPERSSFPEKVVQTNDRFELLITAPNFYHSEISKIYAAVAPLPTEEFEQPSSTGFVQARIEGNNGKEYGIMRFQLKHAWVEDKSLAPTDSGEALNVPGIANSFIKLVKAARTNKPAQPVATNATIKELTPVAGSSGIPTPKQRPAASANSPGDTSNLPNITIDTRSNAILIYDDLGYRDFYANLIRDLDRPMQMIELEAMVIDVTSDKISDLGISWSVTGHAVNLTVNSAISSGSTRVGNIDLIVNSANFLAKLRALNTSGDSRVVSQPSILVMDNHVANIETLTKFYVRVTGTDSAALYPISTGTRLNVTPHVIDSEGEQRRIQMLVSIRDGSVDNTASAMVDNLPRVNERSINTQAVVYHGESLLIGGHTFTEKSNEVAGVPGLSDIPLFGALFQSQAEVKREYVRLFLLQPNLIEMSYDRVASARPIVEKIPPPVNESGRELASIPVTKPKINPKIVTNREKSSLQNIATDPIESPAELEQANLLDRARVAAGSELADDSGEIMLLKILDNSQPEAPANQLVAMATIDKSDVENNQLVTTDNPSNYILQVGAFAQTEHATGLSTKINKLGLTSYTETVKQAGLETIIRVRVGNLSTLNDVQAARATLAKHGINEGLLIPSLPN